MNIRFLEGPFDGESGPQNEPLPRGLHVYRCRNCGDLHAVDAEEGRPRNSYFYRYEGTDDRGGKYRYGDSITGGGGETGFEKAPLEEELAPA